ncbi:IcfG protein [Arenimonas soli]|uniref:IcfG protein n=1 Tax=Arenimonas soli TaxID=2269504 RepID=A0ABQ1HNN9_9GAMM|nr:SpoIIE family protein phosphatase [Arenimonas soli]GGA83432.1 IcfG protein [Arenimonas soli]
MLETSHPVGPIPWRRSLRTRLALWTSLTSILLLAAVALIFYLAIRGVLIANTQAEMRGLSQQAAGRLEATLDSVQVSGRTLAGAASGLGRQPMDLRALMQATLDADPAIAGVMIAMEPGRLGDEDPGFDWYVRRQGPAKLESRLAELGYADFRIEPWYTRTVGTSQPWWSEAYSNDATAGDLFVTYNLPLYRPGSEGVKGGAIGMVSLDVPVRRLRAQLGQLVDDPALVPMLFSPEHQVVMHPRPDHRGPLDEVIKERGRPDLAPLADALKRRMSLEFVHDVPGEDGEPAQRHYSFTRPVGDSGWSFALSVPERVILAQLDEVTLWGLGGGLLGVALCVWAVRRHAGRIARPIEDLTDSAGHLARGEFDYPLRHTQRKDEVGVMARAFDTARTSLKRQMREIADMGSARQKLESELDIARDIQRGMLPPGGRLRENGSAVEWQGLLEPAKAVGGDFYNVFRRDGHVLWFVIGDVSDKGVPAALFMARTMTVLEVAAEAGGSPGAALAEAAAHLAERNETCMFATVLCGVLDLRGGRLSLASAGHEAPVLLHADGRREWLPVPTAGPLGIDVAGDYPVWHGRLEPGDTLLLYTDGVTEAFDAADQAFGEDRMLAALDPALEPAALCTTLAHAVHEFAGNAPQSDDITLLALRYDGNPEGG